MGMVFTPPRVLAGTRLFCVEVPAFVNITMVSIPCDLSVTVTVRCRTLTVLFVHVF